MAERYGSVDLRDAIVELLGVTKKTDLNYGLKNPVKKVTAEYFDDPAIPTSLYPIVALQWGNSAEEFMGASKRKRVTRELRIRFVTREMASRLEAENESLRLEDNIRYIVDSNVEITDLVRGWMVVRSVDRGVRLSDSGFISDVVMMVEVVRHLN